MTLDDVYAWFRYCLQVDFLHFLHQNICETTNFFMNYSYPELG